MLVTCPNCRKTLFTSLSSAAGENDYTICDSCNQKFSIDANGNVHNIGSPEAATLNSNSTSKPAEPAIRIKHHNANDEAPSIGQVTLANNTLATAKAEPAAVWVPPVVASMRNNNSDALAIATASKRKRQQSQLAAAAKLRMQNQTENTEIILRQKHYGRWIFLGLILLVISTALYLYFTSRFGAFIPINKITVTELVRKPRPETTLSQSILDLDLEPVPVALPEREKQRLKHERRAKREKTEHHEIAKVISKAATPKTPHEEITKAKTTSRGVLEHFAAANKTAVLANAKTKENGKSKTSKLQADSKNFEKPSNSLATNNTSIASNTTTSATKPAATTNTTSAKPELRVAKVKNINPVADQHYTLARKYLFKQQTEAAIKELKKAIAAAPDEARSYWLLGMAYNISGDEKKAVAAFERFVKLDPGHKDAPKARATISEYRKNH
ncbi:MAG: tetratricopeptide repeat protein [Deltaproteobacteria bacterium]|nr:tetratricopeptide repeat protein [Deltaproteobacteria bacterium]